MEEQKINAHQSKGTEKRVEKVISGTAKSKKKNDIQKFKDVFVSEDISSVKSYVFMDVIVPALKKAISDVVTNGIDMLLYGDTGKTRKNSASKVSYRGYYDSINQRKEYSVPRAKSGYDYDDIIFENRGDAEAVLDAMNDIISQYGVVSVLDLYDLAEVSTDNYTAKKYGWTDIGGCKPIRVKDGYILKLPKAMPIN